MSTSSYTGPRYSGCNLPVAWLRLATAAVTCLILLSGRALAQDDYCDWGGCVPGWTDPPPCGDTGDGTCPNCAPPGPPGPSNSGPGSSPGTRQLPGGCGTCGGKLAGHGAPYYWVSEWTEQLHLEDMPLGSYAPGFGPHPIYQLSYRNRSHVAEPDDCFSFGTNWSCSFRAYVYDNGNGEALIHKGGAGAVFYTFGIPEKRGATVLNAVSPGATYELVRPGGGKDIFQTIYAPAGGRIFYFLTQRVDPQGNAITFNYTTNSGIFRLSTVADADGKSFTLYYENGTFSNRVTKVVDPFLRTNILTYDELGYPTNISDAQGIATSLKYDSGDHRGWITNMTTLPYGTTSFRFGGVDMDTEYYQTTDHSVNRFIEVTLPNTGKELYLYRANCDDFIPQTYTNQPSTSPLGNTLDNEDQYSRNTFYWSPLQYAALSTNNPDYLATTDYAVGRLRHWLADEGLNPTPVLSLERAPSPDGSTPGELVWYDYPDKSNGNNSLGSSHLNSIEARVLPGGSTGFEQLLRNTFGRVTNHIATYSALNGTVALRTNRMVYAGNEHDLVQHIGPNSEQVVSNYFNNAYHQPDASYDALSQESLYLYNAKRQLIRTITPAGLTTTNIYFTSGADSNSLAQTIDLEILRTNSYTYSDALILSHTDARNMTITNYWDKLQRLTGIRYPDGSTLSNIYTALDLTATKDRLDHWSYFGFNAVRQMIAATNANGVVTRYGYCTCGALLAQTNAWNTAVQQVTTFGYDYEGNRTYVDNADGYNVTNSYNSLQQLTQVGDGTTYRYFYYNNQGLVTNISNSAGSERQTVFDIEDRPIWVTDINGVTVTNTYDDLGRLRGRTYPGGGVESFGYSARGLIAHTNQLGLTNFFAYDAGSKKTFDTNANGELIRYTNSTAGDLVSLTDGKSQTTRWSYDEYGRVTNKTDQVGSEILRYKYNSKGELTNRWSAAKGDTYYAWDPVGNLTNINYPSSADVSFGFDALNRRTNMVDVVGTTVYTYTAGDQLLTEDGPFASDTITNTYVNRLRTELDLQQPSGLWTNAFTYDSGRRLSNVVMRAGTFIYGYIPGLASTLVTNLQLPSTSRLTNGYDGIARLLRTALLTSTNSVQDSYDYIYDPANERTNLTRADLSTVGFGYDKIGQLIIADSSVNTEDRGYRYDAAWNLNWRTNNGSASQFVVDNKNELTNAVGTACAFDSNGNLTAAGLQKVYAYDDENRLSQWFSYQTSYLSPSNGDLRTDFLYDGLGRLRKRIEYSLSCPVPIDTNIDQSLAQPLDSGGGLDCTWVLSSETHYIYDGWRVIQERDTNSTPTCAYTRGSDLSGSLEGAGGIGGLLARTRYFAGSPTSSYFYFADGNGNITYMIDTNQTMVASYRYDPFGNTISKSGSLADINIYRFSSKEIHVNSGMCYYGYRFYDPNLQRWINRDPIRERGFIALRTVGPQEPSPTHGGDLGNRNRLHPRWSEASLFTFVFNDPIGTSDPFGLIPIRDWTYGNWCGYTLSGQNGGPIDELDTACEVHDYCLATLADVLNPCHFWNCNNTFCASAAAADCSKSPDPKACRSAQKDIAIACNALGSGIAFLWGGISK